MSVPFRLRTLALLATGVCVVSAAADIFVDSPGSTDLDSYPDGSFIHTGLDGTFAPVLDVVATNTSAKNFDSLYSWSNSIVFLNAASFYGFDLQAHDSSTINYGGGENPFLSLVTFDDAVINITGGTIGFLGTGGGSGNGGSATISGGNITENASCAGGSMVISGGNFGIPDYGLPFSFISLVPAGITFQGTGVIAHFVELGTEDVYGFGGNIWLLTGTLANGGSLAGLYMIDVGITDPTVIVNYAGVVIEGQEPVDQPPTADAGVDFMVNEGDPAVLDGSLSMDPDGDALSYSWVQLPGGTAVALSGAGSATPSFTAPNVGLVGETLTFELTVTANGVSVTDTVSVSVVNVDNPPIANAGTDFAIDEGGIAMLDGSLSMDPDGDTVTYSWTQLPGGPAVALAGAATAYPIFTAPSVAFGGETLSFQLTVTANGVSTTDTVSISVVNVNHSPVASAGDDQTVVENAAVTLHGEGSFDPDNDTLSYHWVQVGGSPTVVLTNPNSIQPTFTAPWVVSGGTSLVFELQVGDGYPADEPAPGYEFANVVDTVTINVTNVNGIPDANAGCDQVVNENTIGTLHGEQSTDPDGDTLTYAWVQTSGPSVTLTGANTANPTFTAPSINSCGVTLKFKLTVNDGHGGTDEDTVNIQIHNVGQPPNINNAHASDCSLWPPNHQLVNITIQGVTSQNGSVAIAITSVYQDEPTNSQGDGDTAIDAIIKPNGKVLLRAERKGNGNGRVYHVHFTATNSAGTSTGMVKVIVPHNNNGSAVDGGELFDSTQ